MFIPHFEVIEQESDHKRTIWEFSFMSTYRGQLIVSSYKEQTRATKRHNWRNERYYNDMDKRISTMKAEDVPLPQWVKDDAIGLFVDLVKAMPVTVTRNG